MEVFLTGEKPEVEVVDDLAQALRINIESVPVCVSLFKVGPLSILLRCVYLYVSCTCQDWGPLRHGRDTGGGVLHESAANGGREPTPQHLPHSEGRHGRTGASLGVRYADGMLLLLIAT